MTSFDIFSTSVFSFIFALSFSSICLIISSADLPVPAKPFDALITPPSARPNCGSAMPLPKAANPDPNRPLYGCTGLPPKPIIPNLGNLSRSGLAGILPPPFPPKPRKLGLLICAGIGKGCCIGIGLGICGCCAA